MSQKLFPIKYLTTLIIVFGFFCPSFSQVKPDSLIHKNFVKIDLAPLYYDLFDNRVQIRTGVEYERYVFNHSSISCYLDMGLYDKYKFIKYYNFFNENQGMYSIQQNISIIGFHLIPGYNYYFFNSRKKANRCFYAGALMDFSYYQKEFEYFNSQTSEKYSDSYNQKKTGIGLGIGYKNQYGKHLFVELKTSLLTRIFNYISATGRTSIKSLDAQWTSTNYNFWWITNLKIGYAF